MAHPFPGALVACALLLGGADQAVLAADPPAASAEGEAATSGPLQAQPADGQGLEVDQPDGMGHLPGHPSPLQAADDDEADGMPSACQRMMMAHGGDPHHGMGMGESADPHHGMGMGESADPPHGMMAMHEGHGSGHEDDGEDETLAAISAPPPPAWLRGIELDEAQQDRIFDILHETAAAQRKSHRIAEKTHSRLKHLGMATDYSEAEARRLSDEHAKAIGDLTMLRIRTEKRILDVLKPEQRRDAAHQAAREE